ncbi:MAG: hypothetical protein AVDCRST_MAG11-198 [uncultured Gemmatimonadaceae bacterium]|uniref:Uncharacterized protein n=1 Tax=uncultured Gemmatimonadaceae bacterium TaxID=246130 RepID=A0A6J4K082_9BACT|nr:MAG: hypothetical protein AVDCRST_MAG11-198 [uncultured Gemmatimonadaceae bacterium]
MRRVLREAARHERGERTRDRLRQRRRRLREVCRHQRLRGRLAGERVPTGEQLVGHDAPGVQVGPVVRRGIAGRLLGRHVGGRAQRRPHLRDPVRRGRRAVRGRGARLLQRLGDAEVGDHRGPRGEQHVVGLHVPVHDAARVRVGERTRHVAEHLHGLRRRDGAARQPRPQALAVHVRHRVPRQPVGRHARRVHGDDVRLLERRGQLDLPREALGVERRGQLGGEDLHHDVAAERLLARHEDARHARAAQLALQRVGRAEGRLELVAEGVGGGGHGEGRRRAPLRDPRRPNLRPVPRHVNRAAPCPAPNPRNLLGIPAPWAAYVPGATNASDSSSAPALGPRSVGRSANHVAIRSTGACGTSRRTRAGPRLPHWARVGGAHRSPAMRNTNGCRTATRTARRSSWAGRNRRLGSTRRTACVNCRFVLCTTRSDPRSMRPALSITNSTTTRPATRARSSIAGYAGGGLLTSGIGRSSTRVMGASSESACAPRRARRLGGGPPVGSGRKSSGRDTPRARSGAEASTPATRSVASASASDRSGSAGIASARDRGRGRRAADGASCGARPAPPPAGWRPGRAAGARDVDASPAHTW